MEYINGIPVLDLKNLRPSPEEAFVLRDQLKSMLLSYGFCYFKNHSVNLASYEKFLQTSKTFFGFSNETKMLFEKKEDKQKNYHGYYKSSQQSFRERFDFCKESCWKISEKSHAGPLGEFISEFHTCAFSLVEQLDIVAQFLLHEIEKTLGLENEELVLRHQHLINKSINTKSHITSLYYNDSEEPEKECFLMENHVDFTTITLVYSNSSGLEIQDLQGNWLEAQPVKSMVLLHVGEVLERFSGGAYKATAHRVRYINGSSTGRQSIPYFMHPDASAWIQPLGILEGAGAYQSELASDYWSKKMQGRTKVVTSNIEPISTVENYSSD